MRIEHIHAESGTKRARVSADIVWEDCDRPTQRVYFKTDRRFAEDLTPAPEAFVLAAAVPAWHFAERRVTVDGTLCPRITHGVNLTLQILSRWYGAPAPYRTVIEATQPLAALRPRVPARHAAFLSGGGGSLALLRQNYLDFSETHPAAIRDGLYVRGLEISGHADDAADFPANDRITKSLTQLCKQVGVELITVSTNLRCLESSNVAESRPFNNQLFTTLCRGAALAAVAQAMPHRITRISIALNNTPGKWIPWDCYPLLDQNYSSSATCIRHNGSDSTRLEKMKLISEWEPALDAIWDCADVLRSPDQINCGRCEKCIRTMTELLVHGKLARCSTYDADDVTPALIETLRVPNKLRSGRETMRDLTTEKIDHWRELLIPLENVGRRDLARVVEAKLTAFTEQSRESGLRRALRLFDRAYLGERITRINRTLRHE